MDEKEAEKWANYLSEQDQQVYLSDIQSVFAFDPDLLKSNLKILEVGAGTGILSQIMLKLNAEFEITALEPNPFMLNHISDKRLSCIQGFCDHSSDYFTAEGREQREGALVPVS
jgi:ubiquinone/menaquinone biosynthesis C-methylase UbiE